TVVDAPAGAGPPAGGAGDLRGDAGEQEGAVLATDDGVRRDPLPLRGWGAGLVHGGDCTRAARNGRTCRALDPATRTVEDPCAAPAAPSSGSSAPPRRPPPSPSPPWRRRPRPLRHPTWARRVADRKSTRLNSSHVKISYAVFCLKKKTSTLTLGNRCGQPLAA